MMNNNGRLPLSKRVSQRYGMRARKRKKIFKTIFIILLIAAVLAGGFFGVKALVNYFATRPVVRVEKPKTEKPVKKVKPEELIAEADLLAMGYDYDGAIEKIKEYGEDWVSKEKLSSAVSRYEGTKATMVRHADVTDIPHIFFHSLIVDTSKAFDEDYTSDGYNQYMTTISEFEKMLDEMYERGYVLVDIHDIAYEQTQADGTTKFVPGDIMLPEGKKPFVMSQDDVNYYSYMKGDGFADKIVIGEDGMPTCEYILDDGSVVRGDYDLVPILERFINEHPDFSYRGARAALALTGYEGVLGYRTCPTSDDYNEADIEEAKAVAERMRELGWTFASHSWGHLTYGTISMSKFEADVTRWEEQVRPIIGDVDVLIYPYGNDIAGIGKYSGEKYEMLHSLGFKYFCNVDSAPAWVQVRDDYVRQGRRNLDGYRMWYSPDMLDDLFEVETVWDTSRPTPVKPIG